MAIEFAIESAGPAINAAVADRVQRTHIGHSHYQFVDALVTSAVMAWFTAGLVWMVC